MSFIYHGKDRHQCYYRPSCLVCFVCAFFTILRMSYRLRKEGRR